MKNNNDEESFFSYLKANLKDHVKLHFKNNIWFFLWLFVLLFSGPLIMFFNSNIDYSCHRPFSSSCDDETVFMTKITSLYILSSIIFLWFYARRIITFAR